ncbi:MAG: GNAT family N-acetyltransferase [Phycisphaerales bacterium JB039]
MDRYCVRQASTDADLRQILVLQASNLPDAIDADERRAQGFVTLRHDLELLREMNHPWAHLIVTPQGAETVVAYALVMLPAFRGRLPLLEPMFVQLDRLQYRGRPLTSRRWYIMGQVCVAREHRGRGLVELLYRAHRSQMAPSFDLMITEISRANPRSLRAHEKAGFEVICEYRSEAGDDWLIVALDMRC